MDVLWAEYVLSMGYGVCMMFGKPAILLEWKRIFVPPRVRNKFYWTCWIIIVVNLLFYGASFIAFQFYCFPHRKIWDRWVPGKCRDRMSMDAPSTVFNVIIDGIILILPLSTIWKLQMNTRRKIGVSIVFSVGILAVVSAAGRSYTAFTMDYVGDVLYDVANTNMWILGESTCLIVVFCIPTIPKLFGEIKRRGSSAASMTTLTAASSRPGAMNSRHEEFWGRLDDRPDGRAHINDNYGGVDGASQVRLADVEAARPSTSTGQGYGDRSDGGEFGYQNQPWPNKALLR
jgi:uncharacterized membrane protein